MAASRASTSKAAKHAGDRRLSPMQEFVWQGRDRRGVGPRTMQTMRAPPLLPHQVRRDA